MFLKERSQLMKMILAFLVTVLLVPALSSGQNPAEQSGWSANVFSQPGHEAMASVGLLRNEPSVLRANSAPNCGIYAFQITERWSDPKTPPRAPNGGLVSEFIFNGWMEHGKAKVMVWALVNDKDATYASTDEKKLTGQLVDTYLIQPGKSAVINELRRYGAKPVEISIARTK
jgi:hypothetical protein